MEFIHWKEELNLDIPAIDRQHKKLVEIIDEFSQKILTGITQDCLDLFLNRYEDYLNAHFDYEEILMEEYNYQDFQYHKKEHDSFRKRFNKYNKGLKAEDKIELINFASFLKSWLFEHIIDHDKEYVKVLSEKQNK